MGENVSYDIRRFHQVFELRMAELAVLLKYLVPGSILKFTVDYARIVEVYGHRLIRIVIERNSPIEFPVS